MKSRLWTSLSLAVLLVGCSVGGSPPNPPPPPPPPSDLAGPAGPDLAQGPRIVSVTPQSVPRNATTTITVKGSGLGLDRSQPGIWDFGPCPINSYTYTPVDPDTCRLDLQVGALTAGMVCDLTIKPQGSGAPVTYKAAFTITP